MLPDLEIIKPLRKKSGLTQKELSKLTGMSQSYINKIENLAAEPTYSVAKKIIDLLKNSKSEYENVNVKKLMTPIRAVGIKKTLKDAINLMDELSVSQMPVCEGDVIIGSLTKKAIYNLIKKGVKNIEAQIISDIIEPPFPMIPQESCIKLISDLLEYNEAVILLNRGKLAGIITKHDLLKIIK
ncbi:MAG: helix-turn-helix domain-containing protein [Candidatus Nanoarchaeia archaeon]|jgi:predicted transcriptional regulator